VAAKLSVDAFGHSSLFRLCNNAAFLDPSTSIPDPIRVRRIFISFMSIVKAAFKGTVVITLGEAMNQACSLLRNVILARVLTKADFGTAAILGMTVSIFEIGGRLSVEYCVVQSKDGDQPRFIAVAHFLQVVLGLVSGGLILAAARPMAHFFNVPEATWALRVLAIVPVLRSLGHLDVYRMMRDLRFGPGVLIDLIPQVAITLAVWPLTRIWQSYVVLVWLFVSRQLFSTVASHFVAERPYRWGVDSQILRIILSFGWPMLINGLLLYGNMQGDRFAVGMRFTVSELGVYAVAGSLALVPAATLLRLSGSLLLPLLSSARNDTALFLQRMGTCSEIMALFAGVYSAVMIVSGSALVTFVFGAKYHEAGTLIAWLGAGQALRLIRCLPTNGAMSRGDSKNLMYANLFRLSGLALAFPLALAGASLVVIAACSTIGEAVALIGSFLMFSRRHNVPMSVSAPAFSLASAFTVLCAGLAWLGLPQLQAWIPLSIATLLTVGYVGLHFLLFSDSRRLLFSKLIPLVPLISRFAC
jgi:O-antigen/teichoic acid export membrane protein